MIKFLSRSVSKNKDLVGILDGQRAFMGPELVQIDLTNACNNDCIACWCRSGLLGMDRISPDIENQSLSLDAVEKVLTDCAEMGSSHIYLAGGGEPFMHPNIMEILKLIKAFGLTCHVNTNFTLVDDNRSRELVELGIDHLIVSLWAATRETYHLTHPNKSERDFDKLIESLRTLTAMRKNGLPHIVAYHVIMNCNYHEIPAMIELALELGVNAVEFTVADVIPGITDCLLLNRSQQEKVMEICNELQTRMPVEGDLNGLEVRIGDFVDRISNQGATNGNYDTMIPGEIPCYIGWGFSRILADGNVNACLKSHRIPVGNIYKTSFKKIWNSEKQRAFRRKTKTGNTKDPFFSLIGNDENAKVGCHRGCDDIDRNRRLWHRMQALSPIERMILKGAALIFRTQKKFK